MVIIYFTRQSYYSLLFCSVLGWYSIFSSIRKPSNCLGNFAYFHNEQRRTPTNLFKVKPKDYGCSTITIKRSSWLLGLLHFFPNLEGHLFISGFKHYTSYSGYVATFPGPLATIFGLIPTFFGSAETFSDSVGTFSDPICDFFWLGGDYA